MPPITLFRSAAAQSTLHAALADPTSPARATLDSLNGNCFIADTDLNLVYMNRKASETVKELAPAVRSAFNMSLDQLLNGSIHRFHKDPARIDRILADRSALPRTAVFSFGGMTLRTHINAIDDQAGTRHGFVVMWDNVSGRNASAMHAFGDVQQATGRIQGISEHLLDVAGDTSAQADTAAAATEELRAAVAEIARSSAHVADQVREAMAASSEGVRKMEELQKSSEEIGDFLRLITGIAEQTKMLALNATIEAARAGAAGRGFAVVADEVKQLAGATSASITDIESRIAAIQRSAAEGVTTLASITSLVDKINESQDTVAAAIEEQSAVTSEIAQAIALIAQGAKDTVDQSNLLPDAVSSVTSETTTLHEIIINS